MNSEFPIKELHSEIFNLLNKYGLSQISILHGNKLFKLGTIGSDGKILILQTKKEGSKKV